MGRKPCCAKEGLTRGSWSAMEDNILINYIKIHGEGKWRDLPQRAGLKRCGKSCRLRWLNYLRPDIKRGNISIEEEELIIRLHKLLGNRWSLIAGRLPGRTDNEIKNFWNTNLSKRLKGQEITTKHSRNEAPNNSYFNKLRKQDTTLSVDTHQQQHKVIRAKAVKCSRAVNLNIPPFSDSNDSNKLLKTAQNKLDPNSESCNASESPTSSAIHGDNNSIDFFMDFDINELLVSDTPIPDFVHQAHQVDENYGDQNNGECENGFNFSDEVDQLYSKSLDEASPEDLFQTTETLDLRSLASYLNLEDEWIN